MHSTESATINFHFPLDEVETLFRLHNKCTESLKLMMVETLFALRGHA